MASGAADETAATATAVITTQAKASQKQKTDKIRKSPGVQYPKVTSSPGVNFIVMKREAVKRTNMGGSPSTAQPPSQNQISSPTLQDLSPDTRAAISQASKRNPRKLLSEIWTEAEPIYKEGKLVEGKRVHCHQIFAASRQSGTSYMKRHLKGSSQVMGGEAAPSLQGLVDSPLRRTSCVSSSTSRLASTMTVPSKRKAAFELKHSLLQALNKIADRDTYHIGLSELEKAVHALSPDMVRPFLSCVIHTDADQKSAVRKECIKVIATLARCHGSLLAPHMTKVVTSVVKRLKGADSVVMDACVDTCATLSVCARNYGDDGGAVLVALVRPLLESLVKEPNKYVQAGAALCLAKVIDESSSYFPGPLLPRMLARVVKILNNTHFIAKPAVIELITSIVQAEGASTEQALSSALTSIMDSLKSSDWTTRKAASVALSSIAVSSGYLVAPFTTSCLRSLERCKFDKVKPVRVAITHAIQLWKAIPGSDTREPSEAGSSTKENFFGDHHDAPSAGLADWILPLLPNDLLVEILLRLPVKPLHRFKCVSKSCRDLVSCHRKRFPQALAGLFYYHYNWPPEWGRANTLQFINFLARGPPPVDPALAFLPNHASFSVEDCCNGLLLLFSSYSQPRDYLVCNPATKKWVALPNSGVAGPRWHSVLAFDPDVSVHFHVVEYVDQDPNSAVGIYSSRTGGWSHTVLRGTRLYHYSGNPDCEQSWTPVVNGMLHFPCDTEVMSIDLETKEWRHIQLPLAEGDCCDFFGQSDGCLVYVCSDEDAQSFWTLKDYDSGAWSLKHRASHTESGPSSEILGGAFHPHCSILFYPGQEGWLMSYDFDRGELRRIAGTDDFHGYSLLPYVPYFGDFGV